MLRAIHLLGTVTILDGAAVSGAIEVPPRHSIAMVHVPTSWTGADLGFQISTDGGTTFVDVYSGVGTTTSRLRCTGIPTGGASFQLAPDIMHELGLGQKVKLTSINTASNADVNQTGDITLTVWIGAVN